MSCLLKIQEVMSSLTSSEVKIAKFILEHKDEVVVESTQSLAKKIGTSPATLVRFSKSLGYIGFPELKIDLAKDSTLNTVDLTQDLKPNDDTRTLVKKMFNHRIKNLEKLVELISYEQVDQSINYIKEANSVYLIGVGASGLVCRDLYHKLTRIGKNVVYNSDIHVAISTLNSIKKDDILIAISYSGNTKEIILACNIAKERNSKIIGITQMGKNSLSKLSDAVCNVPNCENYLRVGAIDSRDASLYIADLLYLGVAMQKFDEVNIKLKQSRELVSKI